ncbi:ATP-dependent endonuclease [Putridiphycobacter roseus]|uniref:ATP-dependent endonuclease n=1 Tax=Putridiphycobacter roseus TaxID=2219161 RepID=A0A2W1MZS0_9FLAO|nr:AAA family ATPase [Putridiphycobacter roseus]PZE17729.1 ATP-dependent endonuclease [Putridiphycobacter roseus]
MKKKLDYLQFNINFKSNFDFQPTLDQQRAIDLLSDFATNQNDLEFFILTGYAGTGKTSLIAAYIKSLHQNGVKTVNLAPTGRAAKVLSNYSNNKASTIHRKIYFSEQTPEGGSNFTLGKNLHKNTIFIIDEASMIASSQSNSYSDRDLLFDLVEYVYSGENCKLIFVGDTGQLPPIGADQSPALSSTYLKAAFSFDIQACHLNQIVRQAAESGILTLATQLRTFEPEIPLLYSDNQEVFMISGVELQEELESMINYYGQDEVIVISRSNKRANLFNQQIRHRILWQEDDLNAGDVLMVTKNNYFWLDEKTPAGFLANGELIEVLKVIRRTEVFGFEFADISARLIDYPEMLEQEFKININSIKTEGPSLSREEMTSLFYRIAAEEYPYERNKKIRNKLLMQHPYFQALQVKFGYAITGHKSQGGQWDAVFVDMGYFVEDMWDEAMMRWLYTVATRAKEKLYLVNFPKPFTGKEE